MDIDFKAFGDVWFGSVLERENRNRVEDEMNVKTA